MPTNHFRVSRPLLRATVLAIATGAAFAAAARPGHAQLLQIVFQSSTLSAAPGTAITFSGKITNTSASSVTIRGSGFSQVDSQLAPDDSPFFNAIPASGLVLASGASYPVSSFTSLFNVTLAPTATIGQTYKGRFDVLGDPNGTTLLGFQDFFVSASAVAIPEPSTLALSGPAALGSLALTGLVRRRRRKTAAVA